MSHDKVYLSDKLDSEQPPNSFPVVLDTARQATPPLPCHTTEG
jgi:hypothetical protein